MIEGSLPGHPPIRRFIHPLKTLRSNSMQAPMKLVEEQSEDLAYRAEMLRRAADRLLKEARELAARSEAMLEGTSPAHETPVEAEEHPLLYVVN